MKTTTREQHGLTKSSEFHSWQHMRARCLNPRMKHYDNYGGRGIRICSRWESFSAFYADLGPKPSPTHTLDRIDNDGNYEPANCRWATRQEQANNRRVTEKMRSKFFTTETARKAGLIGGAIAGKSRSPAKVAACRRNGALGALAIKQKAAERRLLIND